MQSQKCRNCGQELLFDKDIKRKSEGKPINFEYLEECDFCSESEPLDLEARDETL